MTPGRAVLGFPSIMAALDALREAGVPPTLARKVLERGLGERFPDRRWKAYYQRSAAGLPLPLTAEAQAALARLGWAAPASRRLLRACLGCRAAFASTGPHHRFCDACRDRQARCAPGFEGVRW